MENQPTYRLYSIGQILLATALGSPLPGFWMLSRDMRLLGRPSEAKKSLFVGIGLAATNFAIAPFVPDSVPRMSVTLPFLLATKWIADGWLKPALDGHRASGGKFASWWVSLGLGLGSMMCILVVIFLVLWMREF